MEFMDTFRHAISKYYSKTFMVINFTSYLIIVMKMITVYQSIL